DRAHQPVFVEEQLAEELLLERERPHGIQPRLHVGRDPHHRQRRAEHRRREVGTSKKSSSSPAMLWAATLPCASALSQVPIWLCLPIMRSKKTAMSPAAYTSGRLVRSLASVTMPRLSSTPAAATGSV